MDKQTFYSLRDIAKKLYTINFFLYHLYKNAGGSQEKKVSKKAKKEMHKARKIYERCRLYYPGVENAITVDKRTLQHLSKLSYKEVVNYKEKIENNIDEELVVVTGKGKKLPSRIYSLLAKFVKRPVLRKPVITGV